MAAEFLKAGNVVEGEEVEGCAAVLRTVHAHRGKQDAALFPVPEGDRDFEVRRRGGELSRKAGFGGFVEPLKKRGVPFPGKGVKGRVCGKEAQRRVARDDRCRRAQRGIEKIL